MTKKEEIEAAYKELYAQWEKEAEERQKQYESSTEVDDYFDDWEEDNIDDEEDVDYNNVEYEKQLAEVARRTKQRRLEEISEINKQINELIKRKGRLEFLVQENYPSEEEINDDLTKRRREIIRSFFTAVNHNLKIIETLNPEEIIENYKVEVRNSSYTRRGSDNYLHCNTYLSSHTIYNDDFLKLPEIGILLSSWDEKDDIEEINPDFPDKSKWEEEAKIIEKTQKKLIREYFEKRYNKNLHLKYLLDYSFRIILIENWKKKQVEEAAIELDITKQIEIIKEELKKYPALSDYLLDINLVLFWLYKDYYK